jgi:hypothetical protein
MIYIMKKASVKVIRLEQALAARHATLAVSIFPNGTRDINLICEYPEFLPFVITDEREKILLLNITVIAKRVRSEVSEAGESVGFLSKKAGSFSGVEQRTVQLWTERGLISPDIADTTGTGQRRLYGVLNCIEIGIIQSLAKERLSFKLIREIMAFLRGEGK